MMKIFFLIFVVLFNVNFAFSQVQKYALYQKYKRSVIAIHEIYIFDDGKFLFVNNQLCYRNYEAIGTFIERNDSLQLSFFESIPSCGKLDSIASRDKYVDLKIEVYDKTDSSRIPNAEIFLRDSTMEFNLKKNADENGIFEIQMPLGNTVRFLAVSSPEHIRYDTAIPKSYENDFHGKIYLSRDPFAFELYDGPIVDSVYFYDTKNHPLRIAIFRDPKTKKVPANEFFQKGVIIRKSRREIIFKNQTYKLVK